MLTGNNDLPAAAPTLDTPGPRQYDTAKDLTPRPASTPYSLTPFKSPGDSGYETKLVGPHADYFGAKPMLQALDDLDVGGDIAGKVSLPSPETSDLVGPAPDFKGTVQLDEGDSSEAEGDVGKAPVCRDSSISSLGLDARPSSSFDLQSLWSSDSSEWIRDTDSEVSFRCRTAAAAERVWAALQQRENKPNPVKESTRFKRMSI